ncbi:MAG: M48 family metalloprotease [Ferruginibacter sp.]
MTAFYRKIALSLTVNFGFIFLFFIPVSSSAQVNEPYTYQQLSHICYLKQKDSLKKNWVCPSLYKEKETQKKYKEIWDGRVSFITEAMEGKAFVNDNEIYAYINSIVNDIVTSNSSLVPVKPVLLLDRSASVNAYAIGGNIIAVNIGLITFAKSREEIALVIAHELSHNILQHADNAMKGKAEWLTSAEYQKSLSAVLDSKYERLTRLKKIFENYSFSRSRHNRYHESEADSMAILLLKNSKIGFDPVYFLRLDSSDIQYKQSLKRPLKEYFTSYNVSFEENWAQKKGRGLSTKSYSFRDTSTIADSLKTHPDCEERFNRTKSLAVKFTETAVPANIKEKANKIIIWNLFDNMSMTACMYRILLEKDKDNKDPWYDFMVHNIFTGLFYADKDLNRFNAIGVTPKEYISKDYYQLQTMFEQMPRENMEQYCNALQKIPAWQNMSADAKALKVFMNTVTFGEPLTDKKLDNLAKEFLSNNSFSMYCEFAEHFKKK